MALETSSYQYFFVHNIMGDFFKATLDWIVTSIYPRFDFKVIGTYDKAVEYLTKKDEYGRETDKPMLPAITLNPTGDFSIADGGSGGNMLWRFPKLFGNMATNIFEPIYRDRNITLHPGFIRLKGDIELIMLLNSIYEYTDLKLLFLSYFNGFNRWIEIERDTDDSFFNSFIILPHDLVNLRYYNNVTGETYIVNWESADLEQILVKTTAQNEYVFPCKIKPQFKLIGLNDASSKYGGTVDVAEWKLLATIEYEIEVPWYLILQTDWLFEKIDTNINLGTTYSRFELFNPPTEITRTEAYWNSGLLSNENSEISDDTTCDISYIGEYSLKKRYVHIITAEEASDSTSNIFITIDQTINSSNEILILTKYGYLDYWDDFLIYNSNTIEIIRENVNIYEGMLIEIYTYLKTE